MYRFSFHAFCKLLGRGEREKGNCLGHRFLMDCAIRKGFHFARLIEGNRDLPFFMEGMFRCVQECSMFMNL